MADIYEVRTTREGPRHGEDRASVWLMPIAGPSVLGFYAFAGGTLIVGAHMARWYGSPISHFYLFPFVMAFGGLAQFLAAVWSYRARDAIATGFFGLWSAYYLAYGIMSITLLTTPLRPPAGGWSELAFWHLVIAIVTWTILYAALGQSRVLAGIVVFAAAGETAACVSTFAGSAAGQILAGWLYVISSLIAFYYATALMVYELRGREDLPLMRGEAIRTRPEIEPGAGEPGVVRGQA